MGESSDLELAIDAWAHEHTDYDHNTGECHGMCGHYTQVVWQDSVRVGCALHECSQVEGLSFAGSLLVCQYYKPGNYWGELPYVQGSTASQCSDGSHGGSTGTDSKYTALCNNHNEICGEENRCGLLDSCAASDPLNGEATGYTCEASESGCEFEESQGYEVAWPYDAYNGMADEHGEWKYCWDGLEDCQAWCVLAKDAGSISQFRLCPRKTWLLRATVRSGL